MSVPTAPQGGFLIFLNKNMKFKQKMELAEKLFEMDDRNDRFQSPRFFRPPVSPEMIRREGFELKPGQRLRDVYRGNSEIL